MTTLTKRGLLEVFVKRGLPSLLGGLSFVNAASAKPSADGWQSYETAPTDGRDILARHRVRKDRFYFARPPAHVRFLYRIVHYEPSEQFTAMGKYCGLFWRVSAPRAGWIDEFDEWMALPQ